MSNAKIIEKDGPLSFIRRVGDWAQEGSNNTLLVLGTDRAKKGGPAGPSDGLGHVNAPGGGKGTGTIHAVVGRKDRQGNPDFDSDRAFLYLTMKSRVDENLGLTALERTTDDASACILKADAIRLVARKDHNIKITLDDAGSYIYIDKDQINIRLGSSYVKVEPSRITVDSQNIDLGAGAAEKLILGNRFVTWMNQTLAALAAHTHLFPAPTPTTPDLPTGPAVYLNVPPFAGQDLLSNRTKTK